MLLSLIRCGNSMSSVKVRSLRIWLLEFIRRLTSYSSALLLRFRNLVAPSAFSYCEFADPVIAEATIQILITNKKKLATSFPTLLPQFYPLLLKLIAWNGEKLEKTFLKIFPTLVSPGSFLPLFPSIMDLPILAVALERVEQSSGSIVGGSIASIQKSTAPEILLALMDEAYTGSTIADEGADSESEDSSTIDVADPSFLDLLKDENDGIVGRHWTSPGMAAALQAAANGTQSDRLRGSLKTAPHLLDVYFSVALRDVNGCEEHYIIVSSQFCFSRDLFYVLNLLSATNEGELLTCTFCSTDLCINSFTYVKEFNISP